MKRHSISSSFGPVEILWARCAGRTRIISIFLSRPGMTAFKSLRKQFPDAKPASCPEIKTVADLIAEFTKGGNVEFPTSILRVDLCTPFQQKVLRALLKIQRGKLTTYSELARLVGKPKASRAVGTALAQNPFPIIIPCHRVIKSDGTIGEYQGGRKMKIRLIKMEMRAMGIMGSDGNGHYRFYLDT